MPSIKTTTPIQPGKYYHLFNRGINRQTVFFSTANYHYFLKLIRKYLGNHCEVFAYSLLPNHFHLIVKINDGPPLQEDSMDEDKLGKQFSNQFRRLIISYTMAINKQQKRSSSLFDTRYKRLLVDSEEYLKYLVFYCHFNPVKHELTSDFSSYKFSSYRAYLSSQPTHINKAFILELFGGIEEFINYHCIIHKERSLLTMEE